MNTEFFWDRMSERRDETVHALRDGKTPHIIRFAMHLTSLCNLRCTYCREGHRGGIMDREFFRMIAYRAGKEGILHITGGEPMIVPWLQDEIEALQGITRFALNTNLTIRPRDTVLAGLFRVKSSLDDYNADRWNALTGRKVFTDVCTNIRYVSKHVKYTSVSYTATHQNAHRVEKFIDFCRREFPDLYSVSISFFKGQSEMALQPADIESIFKACEQLDPVSKQVFLETHSLEGNYFPNNLEIPCYLSMTERLYDWRGIEFYCSHMFRDKVEPPGKPGKEQCCVTGCNSRFNRFNKEIYKLLQEEASHRESSTTIQ